MKRRMNFWQSLERYGWKVVRRSPLSYAWMGIGGVLLVVVISWSYSSQTVVAAKNITEIIEMAAEQGDYETAKRLFEERIENLPAQAGIEYRVLGADTELEDKVYPERIAEKRIAELELKLEQYPSSREMFVMLGNLYDQLGNKEMARQYLEMARVLDPNNVEFE